MTFYILFFNIFNIRIFFLIMIRFATIWICNKLLEENKPCNEMAIFKTFVKNRLESEYHAAFEQPERREKFLSYWCYEGILATCTYAFELNISF